MVAVAAFGAVLVAATVAVIHAGLALVPLEFLLRYGPDFEARATGERILVGPIEFVVIGPGCYRMGSRFEADPGDAPGRLSAALGARLGRSPAPTHQMPLHWVEFRRGFAIAATVLTSLDLAWAGALGVGADLTGVDPRLHSFREGSRPGRMAALDSFDFDRAERFCRALSRFAGRTIRLPSEAEWECALRSGGHADDWFLMDPTQEVDSRFRVFAVPPNRWGVHASPFLEWCADRWHPAYRLSNGEGGWSVAPADGSPWLAGAVTVRGDPARTVRETSRREIHRWRLGWTESSGWPHVRLTLSL